MLSHKSLFGNVNNAKLRKVESRTKEIIFFFMPRRISQRRFPTETKWKKIKSCVNHTFPFSPGRSTEENDEWQPRTGRKSLGICAAQFWNVKIDKGILTAPFWNVKIAIAKFAAPLWNVKIAVEKLTIRSRTPKCLGKISWPVLESQKSFEKNPFHS